MPPSRVVEDAEVPEAVPSTQAAVREARELALLTGRKGPLDSKGL